MNETVIKPIAYIKTDFDSKFGIPRQSGLVPSLTGRIVFTPEFRNPDALRGIESFSHLWLIFDFSSAHREKWSPTVRPPRLGGNTRVGVFASRSPFRPNSLGLSSVKLLSVSETDDEGTVLIVSGVDLLNNTPIYDIKPYLPYADSHPDAIGGYTDTVVFNRLEVILPDELAQTIPEHLRQTVVDCIAQDPRPSYQDDSGRVYSMKIDCVDVHFKIADDIATVISVDIE